MSKRPAYVLPEELKAAAEERRGVSERTAAYHLFAADDALVYVGVTCNIARRMGDHKGKVWWHQVARREVTWFDSPPAASGKIPPAGGMAGSLRAGQSDTRAITTAPTPGRPAAR